VSFGNDRLDPGESLRVEMFENNLSEPPIAAQTFSPTTSQSFASMENLGSWLDLQGVARLSVLAGSVDVVQADFHVVPDNFTFCTTTVIVPEPGAAALIGIAGVISGIVSLLRRRSSAKPGPASSAN